MRQPAFTYTFEILDEMYVASYGLPGGPVFVSRGFLQGAASEQAVAEAIARSISHIALRHGTTQATSADAFELGAITGADIGAVIAGPQRSILAQGVGFGVASYFLIYRRNSRSRRRNSRLDWSPPQVTSSLRIGSAWCRRGCATCPVVVEDLRNSCRGVGGRVSVVDAVRGIAGGEPWRPAGAERTGELDSYGRRQQRGLCAGRRIR